MHCRDVVRWDVRTVMTLLKAPARVSEVNLHRGSMRGVRELVWSGAGSLAVFVPEGVESVELP